MKCTVYLVDTYSEIFPGGIGRIEYQGSGSNLNQVILGGVSSGSRDIGTDWYLNRGDHTYTGTTLDGKSYTVNIHNEVAYSGGIAVSWFIKKISQTVTENSVTINFDVHAYRKYVNDSFNMPTDILNLFSYGLAKFWENVTVPANSFKEITLLDSEYGTESFIKIISITGFKSSTGNLLLGDYAMDQTSSGLELQCKVFNPTNAAITADIYLELAYIYR